jgi:hypothetical protein
VHVTGDVREYAGLVVCDDGGPASLAPASIRKANFFGAQLQEADFSHCQLQEARFASAQLDKAGAVRSCPERRQRGTALTTALRVRESKRDDRPAG